MTLIDYLIKDGWLKTPRIVKAFKEIKREDFMPDNIKHLAGTDEAMSIGHGQTISQPLVVAFMLEQLNPKPGDKILDIGSGSGWTSTLLAHIVSDEKSKGKKGKVIAVEIVSELKKFGEKNISKYNFIKKGVVEVVCVDGSRGYKKEAPFDGILASASGKKLPKAWKEQLKINGRIVAPIKNSIWVLEKKSAQEFKETEYPGFVFVPLVI